MKLLRLQLEELISDGHVGKIKSCYKRQAKVHHPDVGGDAEKFKSLVKAKVEILEKEK